MSSTRYTGSRGCFLLLGLCFFNVFTECNGKHILQRQRRTTTTTDISNFTRQVGPREEVDLILVIDRSKGIGKERFYLEELPMIKSIVIQYATVEPSFARIAAITFAKDSTLAFDHISSNYISKCELFDADDASWEKLRYVDGEVAPGTNLNMSMHLASEIFHAGRLNRPNIHQVLLVITDGDYDREEDPIIPLGELRDSGVVIFSLGLGPWLEVGSVRSLASDQLFFGYFEDWENLLHTKLSSLHSDSAYLLTPLPETFCGDCKRSTCFGDVDRGVSYCGCDAGYTPYNYPDGSNCTACEINQYKANVGNHVCSDCPLSFTSSTENQGSTSKDQCICHSSDCTDPCEPNSCNEKQFCTIDNTDKSALCRCLPGWEGANCYQNSASCDNHRCLNDAICYDGVADYICVCSSGFKGRYCEINEDECRYNLCMNGAGCEDKQNDFQCICSTGWEGRFCERVVVSTTTTTTSTTTTTTTPTTTTPTPIPTPSSTTSTRPEPTTTTSIDKTPSTTSSPPSSTTTAPAPSTGAPTTHTDPSTSTSKPLTRRPTSGAEPTQKPDERPDVSSRGTPTSKPTTASSTDPEGNMMYIIIGAAAGGGLLLIIIIIIVCCCCCCRKKGTEAERPPERVTSLSEKFDGLWKKKTVRAEKSKSYIDTITPISGLPSVPKRRPDLLGHMSEMEQAEREVQEAYLSNTTITLSRSMGGWSKYIKELEEGNIVEQCLIAKLTNEEHAKSNHWDYRWEDVYRLYNVMEQQEQHLPIHVQGGEYQILRNDGAVLEGRIIGSRQRATKLAIGITKNYIIVGIADAYSDDGKLSREIQWITDHINTEGY